MSVIPLLHYADVTFSPQLEAVLEPMQLISEPKLFLCQKSILEQESASVQSCLHPMRILANV